MTSANAGNLWLTVQTHHNIISVANLVDAPPIVVTHGKKVPDKTIESGEPLSHHYPIHPRQHL